MLKMFSFVKESPRDQFGMQFGAHPSPRLSPTVAPPNLSESGLHRPSEKHGFSDHMLLYLVMSSSPKLLEVRELLKVPSYLVEALPNRPYCDYQKGQRDSKSDKQPPGRVIKHSHTKNRGHESTGQKYHRQSRNNTH